MERKDLIGRKFTVKGEGVFHIRDVVGNLQKLAIHWYADEGHNLSGSTTYPVDLVNKYITKGSWMLVPEEQKVIDNYSIF